jgi:soluble lytic murein transglycosylase
VMGNRPIEYTDEELQAVARLPGIQRAHDLLLAGLQTEARREWHLATGKMDTRQLKLAARLASDWGWHDRAILTVARSEDYDDLELRFPLEHLDDVRQYAGEYRLDPGHVYAVIRTESAFDPDARSVAGAMGLMQLMPVTGRVTARKNRIPLPGTVHLYDPERNIRIGSAYLKEVMNEYDNNVVLASAAYNAGPQRVERWLPDDQPQQAASWIAAIPFDETRKYVQRILAYAAIYDWRLQRPVIPLAKHMPEIKPRDAYEEAAR